MVNLTPIITLDFDGVCHRHMKEWTNIATIEDVPTEGLADWINSARGKARIALFSSRFQQGLGREAVINWWELWKLPAVEMWTRKPPAVVAIDDRAVTFTGNWKDFPIDEMVRFKPWNRR